MAQRGFSIVCLIVRFVCSFVCIVGAKAAQVPTLSTYFVLFVVCCFVGLLFGCVVCCFVLFLGLNVGATTDGCNACFVLFDWLTFTPVFI